MSEITVIIPMFNAQESILRALHSVKNQTYQGIFDIIVIDDGSTDQSAALVKDFMHQHPDLSIQFIQQKNKGVSSARNTGLKLAKNEYIAFLDADDEWLPEKTEKQMHHFKHSSHAIDFLVTLRNNEALTFPYQCNDQNQLAEMTLRKMLIRMEGQTSTAIFKRKILENTGFFDEEQKYAEDANYWMRISENNKMYILAASLVKTGGGKKSFGESGLSANLKEMEKGIQKNLKEMYINRRISAVEYNLFWIYSKFKYWIRPIRAKL